MNNTHNLYHLVHLPHWSFYHRLPGIMGLYFNASIRLLAVGLVGIFIPLFVYQTTKSLSFVILFFLLWRLFQLLATLPLAWIITKTGPDWAVAIASTIQVIFLATLNLTQTNPTLLLAAAFLGAVFVPLYWIPYHTTFARKSDNGRVGEQVANISIVQKIAGALSPIIGGIIATQMGFNTLYLVSAILLTISVFPIFFDQYSRFDPWPGKQKIFLLITSQGFKPYSLAFLGLGLEAVAYGIFWPLYLMEKTNSLEIVGFISTASLLFSIIVYHWVGKKTKDSTGKLIESGTTTNILNWLLRGLVSSPLLLTLIDLAYQLTATLIWIPAGALVYQRGKRNSFVFFTARELVVQTGFVLGLAFSWLSFKLSLGWLPILLLGAVGIYLVSRLRSLNNYRGQARSSH